MMRSMFGIDVFLWRPIMQRICPLFLFLVFGLAFAGTAFGQTNTNTPEPKQEVDVPLKIINKPHAKTEGRCGRMTEGRTRLRVTFDKSGKVTDAVIVALSGCDTFNRNAVDAAKRIKFTPAIKNGEAVTIIRQIEYVYRIY
jgi:TonB family protein